MKIEEEKFQWKRRLYYKTGRMGLISGIAGFDDTSQSLKCDSILQASQANLLWNQCIQVLYPAYALRVMCSGKPTAGLGKIQSKAEATGSCRSIESDFSLPFACIPARSIFK